MGRTVTQFVALLVLPLGLAVLACFTARELLSWPLLGASLSGAAVALCVIVMSDELCQRFLGADDRERQPHEVGRFLVRLALLHGLAVVGVAGGYMLAGFWAGPSYHQWLCYAGATFGGTLAYAVFLWILFAARDPHLAGPRVLSGAELARAAKKLEEEIAKQKEPPLFFAGHRVPFKDATSHFLVMGATNTGKTLIQRMLMQSALKTIGEGRDQRAVVFNAKQDVLSILAGMNLNCPLITLDPFDTRGFAWDMAADIRSRIDAETLSANLVPIDEHATQKFFDEAVRSLYD